MTFSGEDGPQHTAADAYKHMSDMLAAVAANAREQQRASAGPTLVRVEYVEHLAAGLAARAEEARERDRPCEDDT